jgi:hypothetical protein
VAGPPVAAKQGGSGGRSRGHRLELLGDVLEDGIVLQTFADVLPLMNEPAQLHRQNRTIAASKVPSGPVAPLLPLKRAHRAALTVKFYHGPICVPGGMPTTPRPVLAFGSTAPSQGSLVAPGQPVEASGFAPVCTAAFSGRKSRLGWSANCGSTCLLCSSQPLKLALLRHAASGAGAARIAAASIDRIAGDVEHHVVVRPAASWAPMEDRPKSSLIIRYPYLTLFSSVLPRDVGSPAWRRLSQRQVTL